MTTSVANLPQHQFEIYRDIVIEFRCQSLRAIARNDREVAGQILERVYQIELQAGWRATRADGSHYWIESDPFWQGIDSESRYLFWEKYGS